jgi:hypothetical protein
LIRLLIHMFCCRASSSLRFEIALGLVRCSLLKV